MKKSLMSWNIYPSMGMSIHGTLFLIVEDNGDQMDPARINAYLRICRFIE